MYKKMTFLECLQRNQKVINSCVTVEQTKLSRMYTKFVNRRWYQMDVKGRSPMGILESMSDVQALADYTKFMRETRISEIEAETFIA